MTAPTPRLVTTVGELREGLAAVPDSTPLNAVCEGRCLSSDKVALLGIFEGEFVIDADGDMEPYRP